MSQGMSAADFFSDGAPPPAAPPPGSTAQSGGLPNSYWDSFDDGKAAPTSPQPSSGMPADDFFNDGATKPATNSDWGTEGHAIANFGAGINSSLAGLVGAPVDAATWVLNHVGGQIIPGAPQPPATLSGQFVTDKEPVGGSDWMQTMLGKSGLAPDPRTVPVNGELDQLARAAGSTGGQAVGLTLGARALPQMPGTAGTIQKSIADQTLPSVALSAPIAGAAGQYAENRSPNGWGPIANFGTQLLTGGMILGSVAGTKALIDAGGDLGQRFIGPLSASGQADMAAARLRSAASDPHAAMEALDNPNQELVPGSQPTTFQATGDQGLGDLERWAQLQNRDGFLTRRDEQNAARVGVLENLSPETASPEAVGRAFRQQLDAIDQATGAYEARAKLGVQGQVDALSNPITPEQAGAAIRQSVADNYAPSFNAADNAIEGAKKAAQQSVGALGGNAAAAGPDAQGSALQGYGAAMRSGLVDQNAAAKTAESRLHEAVDPDGTLTVNMQPIQQQARQIVSEMSSLAAPMSEDEAWIFQDAQGLKPVMPYRDLAAFSSRLKDVMGTELSANGRTPAYRRMSQLLNSVYGTLQDTVESRATDDAAAVQAGIMSPDDAIVGRLQNYGSNAPETQTTSGGYFGSSPYGDSQGREANTSGPYRANGSQGGGFGRSAGNPSVAGKAGQKEKSIVSFLTGKGGINDPGGDLKAMDAGKQRVGFLRVNGGLSLDYAREAAEQAGYLKPNSTTNDLLDAISEDLHGRKVFKPELNLGPRQNEYDSNAAAFEQAQNHVLDAEEEWGGELTSEEIDHATRLVALGMHPQEAIRNAGLATSNAALDRNASRLAFSNRFGVDPEVSQSSMNLDGASGPATWDAEAATRKAIADAATAQRHATFTNAPGVGEVIRHGRTRDTFRDPASSVPGLIFTPGKGAAERIQAYQTAGGNLAALRDYAAFSLRRAAQDADGTLNLKKYQAWLKSHAEALSALPDLKQSISTAAKARDTLDEAVSRRVDLDAAYPIKPSWTDADVAKNSFQPGANGADAVRRFRSSTGNNATAQAALEDHAAQSLRAAAESLDGTLNQNAYDRWMKAHSSALSEMPELKVRLKTAGNAQQALLDAAEARRNALDAYQKSAASHFLGDADPVRKIGSILRSDRSVTTMRDLSTMTANDPDARAGLQKAVTDFMLQELKGNSIAGLTGTARLKSDQLQTFIRKSVPALRHIFNLDQIKAMENVAADLQRAEKSVSGTKLPGGSNTPQDLAAIAHHGGAHQSVLTQVVLAEAIGQAAEHVAGPAGKTAGIGAAILNGMRQAGIGKVDNLVTQAMLHPELAKALLARTPASAKAPIIPILLRNLRAGAGLASIQAPMADRQKSAEKQTYTGLATPYDALPVVH